MGADERLVIPRWAKVLVAVFVLFVGAAIAFAVFEPLQVLPRMRLAPGYALTDQDGRLVTSEDARGSVTLYGFTALDCGEECDDVTETMRRVGERVRAEVDLGDVELRLVSIVVDPRVTQGDLVDAASAAAADPSWRWLRGDDDTLRRVVGGGFQRYYELPADGPPRFDSGFMIVDGNGIVRGDYRYDTLADTADKLTRHLSILSSELRYGDGAAGFAFEAAHLFLCYP